MGRWIGLPAAALLAACSANTVAVEPAASTPSSFAPAAASPLPAPSADTSPPVVGWPTYQHDAARSGSGDNSPAFDGVRQAWATKVDGQVYAQPLSVGGRVFVATENNTVYALDPATGAITWRTHFGAPIPISSLPCGNIDPTGITGTPVADPATGTLYAVAFLAPFHHELYALAVADGSIRWHLPIDPPGVQVRVHQQRSALTLAGGRVYVPYGGLNGDCDQYTGWVMGTAADGTGGTIGYQVPTRREGGIWATGGASLDGAGNLYVAIGNAASTTTFDYGNAVVRLTPELKQAGFWAPSNWAELSRSDDDIGSISPLQLPGGLLFQSGKAGTGYLLRSSALGGIGGEVFSAKVCNGAAFGAPALAAGLIYVPCGGGITALRLSADRFETAWHGPGGWPPIAAYGSIWTLTSSGSATLVQLDPLTGAVRSRTAIGTTNHFCTPSAADAHIYVPAGTRVLAFNPAA